MAPIWHFHRCMLLVGGPGANIVAADAQGQALLAGLIGFIRTFLDASQPEAAATG